MESSGFPPFDLLYGRHVRSSLVVLIEDWTRDRFFAVSLATCLIELQNQLAEMAHLVTKIANVSRSSIIIGVPSHSFEIKGQVLVLLPTAVNRLKLRSTAPYK